MSDAMSILDMEFGEGGPGASGAGGAGSAGRKRDRRRTQEPAFKRPDGMHRELYALIADSRSGNDPAPIIPTDAGLPGGYKQNKAKLGLKKARPWQWMEFVNPGREDGFRLRHWRRTVDSGKEYPFAKFNKRVTVQSYTDQEYVQHLQTEEWSKAETDHLFDLCRRFDLRFIIIADRWDREKFNKSRSVEDLKERYYKAFNILSQLHHSGDSAPAVKYYDAAHERKRKDQLIKLYNRSPELLEEEQELLDEFRKIEQRKREREKKTQDLQKLITAADSGVSSTPSASQKRANENSGTAGGGTPAAGTPAASANRSHSSSRSNRKKVSGSSHRTSGSKENSSAGSIQVNLLEACIKFPEIKNPGPYLRSQRMKLPGSVGQKKTKAIEQLLNELNIDLRPMPTEEICQSFNELRSEMVLLYELKMALANCEFELQTLKHQLAAMQPTQQSQPPSQTPAVTAGDATPAPVTEALPTVAVSSATAVTTTTAAAAAVPAPVVITEPDSVAETATETAAPVTPTPASTTESSGEQATGTEKSRTISEVIDVGSVTPNRKRRAAALEQQAFLSKVKKM